MFWNRLPSYALGLLIGLSLLLVISKVKKTLAPEFAEYAFAAPPLLSVKSGGWLELDFLVEPGLKLPPGFPSQVRLSSEDGASDFGRLNYRQITASPKHRLPLPANAGRWRLAFTLYTCKQPAEKYCARLVGSVAVETMDSGPDSITLPIDIAQVSDAAAKAGAASLSAGEQGSQSTN
jgi:hypothetical protein